ncbi:DUF2975 domain-containing protein [Streptococcus ovis]|uniref:DUF2975 domain-containing protein n=1 Tax=Streptococcus ovis TaxID=82806 RepID=UPI00037C2ED8|nr:DUF2975 domain-containing protein [Streptococcus ovis]
MSQKTISQEDMSILLTKLSLIVLFIASLLLMCTGSWVVKLVIAHPSPFFEGDTRFWVLLSFGYVLGILALLCIVHLYQLVARIGHNHVFIPENVHSLRLLGWEVALVAVLSLFMGLTAYLPMLLITVACSLLTLIIRVIRNAFGKAVELQEQVDYTI